MGPGPMGFGPPPKNDHLHHREEKPKRLLEVPSYLKRLIGGTLRRLFYIFKLVWEAKRSLLFLRLFMTLYNGFFPLIETLITARLLEEVVLSFTQEVDLVWPLAFHFGFLFLNTLVTSLDDMITRISGEVVTNYIKVKIMNKAKEVDLASFDMPDFYERMENANREAGMRPVNILNSAFSLVSTFITLVSYFVVLATLLGHLDSMATVIFALFLVLSLLSACVNFHYKRQNFFYMRRKSKERRQMNYYSDVQVNKDYVKEVKLFGLADIFIDKYKEVFGQYFKGVRYLILKEGAWSIFFNLCTAVTNALLFYMVAVNVKQIGDYSIYTAALQMISSRLSLLIRTTSNIYEGSLFIDNMILFMNEKKTVLPSIPQPRIPQRRIGHTISFSHVSFAYPGTTKKVLNDISFTLEAGETAVLVGLNGAGKTTLIKLITRLYDPTEGEIFLDGINIKEYDVEKLYEIFGIIFQDFGKYAVSVKDNIAFGDVDRPISEASLKEAAQQANADVFIEALKEKYDTPLMRYFEPNGTELSIGQWQKLSIARAFYADSDILILDEPTASLDPIAEQEIFNQFDALRKDKTTIFVSHRLSSATNAHKILVLKHGRIVEMGDHAELMEKKGEYFTLFTTQAKRYHAHYPRERKEIEQPKDRKEEMQIL